MIQHRNHTTLQHLFSLGTACLCGCMLWSACSSEDEALPTESPTDGVTVEVELSTRTLNADDELVSYPQEHLVGTQHATQVMIYFFKGIDESAEFCNIQENIGWKDHFTANGGTLPTHTASMTYRLQHKPEPNTPYRFLAVGMNDEGAASFTVPLQAMAAQGQGGRGTTLAEAVAQLNSPATTAAIRRSEIYVGTANYEPQKHSTTRITLHRRVAGVAGWFTNIPKQVASLRISLYAPQNTQLPLLTRQQKPNFEDYIQSPAGDQDATRTTLIEMAVPTQSDSQTVVHGASFVLPIPAPADKETYTLCLELLDAQQKVISTRRIKLKKGDDLDHGETGGGTGIIDTESAFRFPIVANHYYAIGKPDQPVDLKGSGADLIITVEPNWNENAELELGEKN